MCPALISGVFSFHLVGVQCIFLVGGGGRGAKRLRFHPGDGKDL